MNSQPPAPDTRIRSLGRSRFACLRPEWRVPRHETVTLHIGSDLIDDLRDPVPMEFELAGPRGRLYFEPQTVRGAVMTCGGTCPGLNDVIRSIVMTAHRVYRVSAMVGIRNGLQGLVTCGEQDTQELTVNAVEHIHEFGGTVLGTSRGPQDPVRMVDALQRLAVTMLFVIGGDGSMRAAAAIEREAARRGLELAVIGIPKTIDNDIHFIPQSFGFETAVSRAAEAVHCACTEAASVRNGVGIVKLMGRESGFIAAHAALALPEVSFVLVPEVPFSLQGENGLLAGLERLLHERGHAVIVVAEGAGQELLEPQGTVDASGNRLLGDIAGWLAARVKAHCAATGIPCYIKYIDPSYLIRSVPANAVDRVYCGFLGQHAVHAAMAGRTGMVVAKIMNTFVHLPLALVTRKRRTMNAHSDLWRSVLELTGQGPLTDTPDIAC